MNTRTISTCLTDAIKAMDGFASVVRRMVSVINATQEFIQAALPHGEIAGERIMRCNIAECERHGCVQMQYDECHLIELSPCCVRRICPIRPISPTRHRALLAKHHCLIGDEVAIVEGKFEPNQKPEDKIVHRSAALPRKRRQAVIPVVSASPDDEMLE